MSSELQGINFQMKLKQRRHRCTEEGCCTVPRPRCLLRNRMAPLLLSQRGSEAEARAIKSPRAADALPSSNNFGTERTAVSVCLCAPPPQYTQQTHTRNNNQSATCPEPVWLFLRFQPSIHHPASMGFYYQVNPAGKR